MTVDTAEWYGRCPDDQLRDEAQMWAGTLNGHGWTGAAERIVNLTEALITARGEQPDYEELTVRFNTANNRSIDNAIAAAENLERAKTAEAALLIATTAFAQYALDTNTPSDQAVADFVEGFRQQAALTSIGVRKAGAV